MNDSQHLNREQIHALQSKQLKALLEEIIPANRFYSSKLEQSHLSPGDLTTLDEFKKRMPFTFKKQLEDDQLASPPYGTNLTYLLSRYTRYNQTSGSRGTPLRWLDTPESWNWMCNNWRRVYQAADVQAEDRIYFAFSFGPFLGFWTAYEAATHLGCLCIPGGGLSSVARLKAIRDNQVTVLCCTPTYAVHLAEVALSEGIDLQESCVNKIMVAGEPGGSVPATRSLIQRLWNGARVFDHHGMTEVGPVSYECPDRAGLLHIIESSYIAEVVDSGSGKPAPKGHIGELVLTTLGRTGSPLLRYRTGDLVNPSTSFPCSCGSYEIALEGGIIGRADDMMIIRGVNIHPCAVESVVRSHKEIAEYRIERQEEKTLAQLVIRVELSAHCQDENALVKELEDNLRAAFNLRIPVQVVPPGGLPRSEMKSRRWDSH